MGRTRGMGDAAFPDRNRTLRRPDRLGGGIGTIGEGEEWDYDLGGEHPRMGGPAGAMRIDWGGGGVI